MKYFLKFDSARGSLAIEKEIHGYIQERFDRVVVDDETIRDVCSDLQEWVTRYKAGHKASKDITINAHRNACTGGWFISAGQLYMVAVPIKNEILKA